MSEIVTVTEENVVITADDDVQVIQTNSDQVLIEDSNTGPQGPGASDHNFVQSFTAQSSVTVTHGFNKYPAVTVIDISGSLIECEVQYLDLNNVMVTFDGPFSGKVICN